MVCLAVTLTIRAFCLAPVIIAYELLFYHVCICWLLQISLLITIFEHQNSNNIYVAKGQVNQNGESGN